MPGKSNMPGEIKTTGAIKTTGTGATPARMAVMVDAMGPAQTWAS